MRPFSLSSVGTTVGSLQQIMAPTSLPSVLPRRSPIIARAEHQLGREWNSEAAKIGIVVGIGVAVFGFCAVKALRKKGSAK